MLLSNSAIRLVIGVSVIISVRATAQQAPNAAVGGAAAKEHRGPPANLKLSPLAKEWFKPSTGTATPEGKQTITVIEDDDMWADDLAALRYLPDVNRLCLGGGFSGKDLAQLNGLRSIEYLQIDSHVPLTDHDLEGIATLRNLRELVIVQAAPCEGNISDKGLDTLSLLPHLQVLELRNANITEGGLELLKKFPELREVRLACANLTWDSLAKFPKLDKLHTLTMWCVPRDEGAQRKPETGKSSRP